jgi:hypothetical protein
MKIFTVVLFIVALFPACSSAAKVGETCDKEGATEGCESNAACGKNPNGALVCQRLCTDQAQCAATESCNGLTGSSLKTCRVK